MKAFHGNHSVVPQVPQRLVWRHETGRDGWRREQRRVWIVAPRPSR